MPKTLIFVDRKAGLAKDTQKPYDILTLSNGLRAGNVYMKDATSINTDGFKEGDKVEAKFEVDLNYANNWTAVLISLSKVK